MCWSSPPTMTWSTRCCALPTCASTRAGRLTGRRCRPLAADLGAWSPASPSSGRTLLWLLLLVPAAGGAVCPAAAPAQEGRAALCQPGAGQGGDRRRASACGGTFRRALMLLALDAAARGDGAPVRGGHAAVAARDRDAGDGRLGQHARHRRQAQPHRRRAGGGARLRRRPAARRRASASSSFAATASVVQSPTTAARTSWPPSTASSCSAAPRWAAASWCR